MSAVARLVLAYFTRTHGLRWLSLGGLIALVVGSAVLPYTVISDLTGVVAFLGGLALVVGAGLMPLMVGRMATSHVICVLPYGRLKLFLSALITVMLVSVPLPLFGVLAQIAQVPPSIAAQYTTWQVVKTGLYLFEAFYVTTFLAITWLYIALWFATSERNARGLAKALLVIIAVIYAPTQRIIDLDPKFHITTWEAILMWGAFGTWLAYVPGLRGRKRLLPERSGASNISGQEFDVLLGTARPWLVALGILFPITVQVLVGYKLPNTWLMYLTLFSAVSGALASRAAERSRAIWLRARWSREELFARVETAFWKHNIILLAVVLTTLVVVTRLYDLPARVIPLGVPLLLLGMTVSTYLGLMMTRGLRWSEATLAIVIMLSLMGTAVLANSERGDVRMVVGLLIVFAMGASVLRFTARARWHRIDWMLCRADRSESARLQG